MPETVGINFVGTDSVSHVANNVKVSLDAVARGANTSTAAIATGSKSAASALAGVNDAAGLATGGIEGLGAAIGVGALLTLGLQAGRAVIDLTNIGQQSAQIEKRFVAFAGGADKAKAALAAVSASVGDAMDRDEQMLTVARIMGLEIVNTAQDAGELAQMAIWLGDSTESTQQRIQGLTQALVTGRTMGLAQYGIAIGPVKERVKELQEANIGLSDSAALTQAVMEAGRVKMSALKDENYQAVTSTQKLEVAMRNLKDAMGDIVAPKVAPVIDAWAGILQQASGKGGDNGAEKVAAVNNLKAANADLLLSEQNLEQALQMVDAAYKSGDASAIDMAEADAAAAQAQWELSSANREGALSALDAAAGFSVQEQAANDLAIAAHNAAAGIRAIGNASTNLPSLGDIFAGNPLGRWTSAYTDKPSTVKPLSRPGFFAEQEDSTFRAKLQELDSENKKAVTQYQIELDKETAQNATTAWKAAASDAAAAWKQGIADIKNELTQGMNVSKGLSDLTKTGGGGAEDPNGWMKDIRRLQAWVQDNSWGETAQKYGITSKEDATERIRKFQSGQWDASVTALIDKDKLANQIKQSGAANTFMDAFAAEVSKISGQDPKVVQAMLGFQADKNGAGAMDMKPMATAVTSSFATEIATQSAEFTKSGATLFDYVGQGFVDQAKASGILLRAVQAMVLSLLPKAA